MEKAIIRDNLVYCNQEHHNYKIKDYKEVIINSKKYVKFIARCNECGNTFYFFSKITIDKEEHFIFDEEEGQEINEQEG